MSVRNSNSEFDIKLFFFIARKNLLFIVLFGVVVLSSMFLYLRYTAPVYESYSTFQLSSDDKAGLLFQTNNIYENDLSKKVEILRSSVFMRKVLSNLPVDVSVYSKGKLMNTEMYNGAPFKVKYELIDSSFFGNEISVKISDNKCYASIGDSEEKEFGLYESVYFPQVIFSLEPKDTLNFYNANDNREYVIVFNDINDLAYKYTRKLNVSVINDAAKTIKISLKDNNAEKSAAIVNEVVRQFELADVEKQSESTNNILQFIDEQMKVVEESLSISEDSLRKVSPNPIDTVIDKTSLTNSAMQLEREIAQCNLEIQSLNKLKALLNNGGDVVAMSSVLTGTASHAFVAPYLSNLQQLDIKRQEYLQNMTESSSGIVGIDKQIAYQKRLVKETIENLIMSQSSQLSRNNAELQRINRLLGVQVEKNSEERNKIERYYSVNEKFYNQLIEKKIECSIAVAGYVSSLLVLEPACVNNYPVFPNKKMIWILGFLFIIVLVIMFLVYKYFTYNEITSLNDVNKFTSVPILGVIPRYKRQIPVSQLVVDSNPQSLLAEALRAVRANLQFIKNGKSSKVVAVTSTVSGEGKTFVAINLAGILSYSENNVIVLDFDMRRPKIHLGFHTDNVKGVSSILSGNENVDDCICHSSLPNLHFITAGPEPINPSELILSEKMDEMLDYLKSKYSYVIIDNPPIGLVSDSLKCLQYADYPIYVLRANYSKREYLYNIDRLNKESRLNNLSVILNDVDPEITSAGSSKGFAYGYGYGSEKAGYYSEDVNSKDSFLKRMLNNFKR